MSLTTCNLHFTQQPDKVIYVSSSLMKSLNLSGKKDSSAIWEGPGAGNHQANPKSRQTSISCLRHSQPDERSEEEQRLPPQFAK